MGKSCLVRLVIGFAVFAASSLIGGVVILGVSWLLYPVLNPPLYALLTGNGFPMASDALWAFWTAVPCCFNLPLSAALGLAANRIFLRAKPAK
ncbi:MAG: hypothetical protein JW748_08695 [Anaerolineales bacterium]|nr:hypothetical protein [Anaerolineales bacterium]